MGLLDLRVPAARPELLEFKDLRVLLVALDQLDLQDAQGWLDDQAPLEALVQPGQ